MYFYYSVNNQYIDLILKKTIFNKLKNNENK
jgi:hypothetical protein